jgi:tetratricopeptide (TPR) repeat protein
MQLHGNPFEPTPELPRLTARRAAFYFTAIAAGSILLYLLGSGTVRSPYAAPPTATRSAQSFTEEGDAFFAAGQLEKAIEAYAQATAVDPKNPVTLAELARIQTYSSALIISTKAQSDRLAEARTNIQKAIDLDKENGHSYTIQTLVLDWSSNPLFYAADDVDTPAQYLNQAFQASVTALRLLPNDALALAFQAEVLVDQTNWSQALDKGAQAVKIDPNIMDVRRAYGYVLESNGYYSDAIEQYNAAIRINPNLPFLYMRLGANYRHIGETTEDPNLAPQMILDALDAFSRAAALNDKDPLPYLSIANTYANQGEFFIAERNAQKALSLDNTNASIYGRLGTIYYKAKNYESARIVLKCAVLGCTALENEEQGVAIAGLPLAANTLDFYYIFGSVSAFYADCIVAEDIFAKLRASPFDDQTVESIIQEGERICAAAARTPTPSQ